MMVGKSPRKTPRKSPGKHPSSSLNPEFDAWIDFGQNYEDLEKEFEEFESMLGSSADESEGLTDGEVESSKPSQKDRLSVPSPGKPSKSPHKSKSPAKSPKPTPKKKKKRPDPTPSAPPPWTYLEDHMLLEAAERHPDRWNAIVQAVPGRTMEDCRDRLTLLRAQDRIDLGSQKAVPQRVKKHSRVPRPKSPVNAKPASPTPKAIPSPMVPKPPLIPTGPSVKAKSIISQTRLDTNVLRIQAPKRTVRQPTTADLLKDLGTDDDYSAASEYDSGADDVRQSPEEVSDEEGSEAEGSEEAEESSPERDDMGVDEEATYILGTSMVAENPPLQGFNIDALIGADGDGPVAQRTRQHVSLQQVPIDALDNLLPASIFSNASSLGVDWDQVRYDQFQLSLAQSPPPASDPIDDGEYDPSVLAPVVEEEDSDSSVEDTDEPAVELQELEGLAEEYFSGALMTPLPNDSIYDGPKTWAFPNSNIFTPGQIQTLRSQIAQNLQILSQVYVMQSELHGQASTKANHWRRQLQDLYDNHQNASQPSFHSPPKMDQVEALLKLPISSVTPEAKKFHEAYHKPYNRGDWHTYKTRLEKNLPATKARPLTNTKTLTEVVERFGDSFTKELIPDIFPLKRNKAAFSEEEDNLMLYGLQRFGEDDWPSIQAHFLPARGLKQTIVRHKNSITRQAEESLIKSFSLRPIKPLTAMEEEILITGSTMYGEAFKEMSVPFFKVKSAILRTMYEQLTRDGRIPLALPPPSPPNEEGNQLEIWQLSTHTYGATGQTQDIAELENQVYGKWLKSGGQKFHESVAITAINADTSKATTSSGKVLYSFVDPIRIVPHFKAKQDDRKRRAPQSPTEKVRKKKKVDQ